MKKYLIQGALALVASATLVSCHVDDDFSTSIVSEKFKAYEQVFEEEFGKINPNQDWGFGEASQATRTRAAQTLNAPTRALSDNLPAQPTFRSKPAVPTFSSTVPSGTLKAIKENWAENGTFYIDNTCSSSDLENPQNQSGVTIYANGNNITYPFATNQNGNGTKIIVTQNSTLTLTSVGNNLTVYLASGATLNLPDYSTFKYATLYMGSGSTINVAGDHNIIFAAGHTIINDGGTFNSNTNLTVREASLMYNEHDITVNTLNIEDTYTIDGVTNGGEIVNNATINATNINMKAGGKFHNLGTVKVSNKTYITNDDTSQWMNDGQYTTGEFYLYDCNRIYNNCKLTVTSNGTTGNGKFTLAESQFVLNGNASVICDSFEWESNAGGQFHMGSKSLLKVNGTILLKSSNYGYGFHGYGSDYAVIQANKIDKDTGGQYKAWYDGKLYIATDDHFAEGGTTSQPWIYSESEVIFKGKAPCPVTISSTNCNPGYSETGTPPSSGDDPSIPIVNENSYTRRTYKQYRYKVNLLECGRIMCEDLGKVSASDIDFNDVVFDAYIYKMVPVSRKRIVKVENGQETTLQDWSIWSEDTEYDSYAYKSTDIYLLAGGGTIPVTVAGVDLKNAYNTSHTMLINTVDDSGEDDAKTYGNVYDNSQSYKQPADLKDLRNINTLKDIKIVVKYGSQVYELEAYKGAAPHKICVPIGTRWPYERVEINEAYSFEDYVKTYTPTDTTVTYNGDESKVVKEIIDAAKNIVGYYIDEFNNEVWTASPTTEQNKNRYKGSVAGSPVPYTARAIDSLLDRTSGDGLPEDNQYTEETVTISSGYNSGDPVLVRRRH